jgi:TfoX/Sxy family transcriptional regulator of competence genes
VRAFDDSVQSLSGIERRKMFGYPAIFISGNMVAGLVRDNMILRLSMEDTERFLALPGAAPFIAMGGRRMRQWVVVPPALSKSKSELAAWLERAMAHGRALPRKSSKRNRGGKARHSKR